MGELGEPLAPMPTLEAAGSDFQGTPCGDAIAVVMTALTKPGKALPPLQADMPDLLVSPQQIRT